MGPLSPAYSNTPLPLSGGQNSGRPRSLSRRKSSSQTIQTIGNKRNKGYTQHGYAASTMSGHAGRSNSGLVSAAPGGVSGKDGQWATMDPDEVFRRLNVKEVRKVEDLLRSSAAGKQGELRNMVRSVIPNSPGMTVHPTLSGDHCIDPQREISRSLALDLSDLPAPRFFTATIHHAQAYRRLVCQPKKYLYKRKFSQSHETGRKEQEGSRGASQAQAGRVRGQGYGYVSSTYIRSLSLI